LFDENIDVGIEPNGSEIQRAREINLYDELIECYGDNIPKPDGEFQTIFSNSVLEHIPDIEAVLKEINRLLKDDGVVYLTLPTNNFDRYSLGYQILSGVGLKSLANRYCALFNEFWNHYHFYSESGWEAMFERCGFKVREQFEYGSKVQCLFNNFASPFCFFSFMVKKMTNRWFLFPSFRTKVTRMFHVPLFATFAKLNKQPTGKGGLIFFAIEKDK
jgi:SAM-dependent methyltransferase